MAICRRGVSLTQYATVNECEWVIPQHFFTKRWSFTVGHGIACNFRINFCETEFHICRPFCTIGIKKYLCRCPSVRRRSGTWNFRPRHKSTAIKPYAAASSSFVSLTHCKGNVSLLMLSLLCEIANWYNYSCIDHNYSYSVTNIACNGFEWKHKWE
jgi:hypothetical protein